VRARHTRRGVAAGAFAALLALVYAISFTTRVGLRADKWIFEQMQRTGLHRARGSAHPLGAHALTLLTGAAVAVGVASLAVYFAVTRRPRVAAVVAFVFIGSFATTEIVKPPLSVLGRRLAPDRVAADSFPSGHATIAMAALLIAVIAAPPRVRLLASVLCVAIATVVALLVVATGLHPPSDVVGGYLVSAGWAATLAGLGEDRSRTSADGARPARARGHSVIALAGVAVVLVVLVAGLGFGSRHKRALVVTATLFGALSAVAVGVTASEAARSRPSGR
jgi:membrane-associated phospholipid phosphatase